MVDGGEVSQAMLGWFKELSRDHHLSLSQDSCSIGTGACVCFSVLHPQHLRKYWTTVGGQ